MKHFYLVLTNNPAQETYWKVCFYWGVEPFKNRVRNKKTAKDLMMQLKKANPYRQYRIIRCEEI